MNEKIYCLVRVRTAQGTRSHLFQKSEFTIGRSQDADMPVPEPSMSRVHLKIVLTAEGPTAIDLGSANGTRLGKSALEPQKPFLLKPNDHLQCGLSEDFYSFELVSVPLEMQDPESVRQSYKEILGGLQKSLEEEQKIRLNEEKGRLIEAWNQEYESLKKQAQQEIQNIKSRSESEAESRKRKAEADAEEFNRAAVSKIEVWKRQEEEKFFTMQSDALKEFGQKKLKMERELEDQRKASIDGVQKLTQDLQEKANLDLRHSQEKAKEMILDAHKKSEELVQQAKAEIEGLRSEAKKQIEVNQRQAQEFSDSLVKQARESASSLQSKSQQEAETIVQTARKESQEILSQAKAQIEASVQEQIARHQQWMSVEKEELEKSKLESQQKMKSETEAFHAEFRLRKSEFDESMQRDRQSLVAKQKDQEEQLRNLKEKTEADVARLRKDTEQKIKEDLERAARQIETQRSETLRQTKIDAEKTQQSIVVQFEKQVQEARQRAEQEQSKLENLMLQEKEFSSKSKELESQISKLQSDEIKLKGQVEILQNEKTQALAIIQQRDQALADKKKAEEATAQTQNQLATMNDEIRAKKAAIEAEAKALRDKLIVENENLKRELSDEAARTKLKAFEELKRQIEMEQRKVQEIRKAQVTELSRAIELRLTSIKQTLPAEVIFKTVAEVLGQTEQRLKVETQHLVETPEKAQEKRRKKFQMSVASGAAVLGLLGFWKWPMVKSFLLEGGMSQYAAQLLEYRKKSSVYSPEQDGKYRNNYTDNVLHFAGYFQTKVNPEYTTQWTLQLNNLELVRSLELTEDDMVQYISKEFNLVRQLGDLRDTIDAHYLDQGIARMRTAEKEARAEMLAIVKTEANLNKLRKLEKESLEKFQTSQLHQAQEGKTVDRSQASEPEK